MNPQILILAPFRKLAQDITEVIEERFGDQKERFQIVEADLQAAQRMVTQELGKDIHVLVSRGGTATLLKRTTSLPVVRIQMSLMDMLQVWLRDLKQERPHKIAIVGFESAIYGAELLAEIFQTDIREICLKSEAEAEERILAAIQEGVDVIVGDAVSARIAREQGIQGITIESGKQAIFAALQEALVLARVVEQDLFKSKMITSVVNHSPDGVVAVNKDNKVTLFNTKAEQIFHRLQHEVLGHSLQDFCMAFAPEKLHGEEEWLLDIYGRKYMIKAAGIEHGSEEKETLYTLSNVTEVQRMERTIRKKILAKGLTARYHMEDIVGESPACQTLRNKASRYALTDSTILVTGESGTGKELLVQSIHNRSRRASGPFVAVNCAALPENLLESELFGYVGGAFTGARKDGHQGVFELAHGGTLFLDEIGEMSLPLQSRLLRVLQERQVMPIGGESIIPVDVRVIAATNQNLSRMVHEGTFRSDLYYRLNILRIRMPNLQERRQDIPALVASMMHRMQELNPVIAGYTEEAIALLMQQTWEGNIRQLSNLVERMMLLTDGREITRESVENALADDAEDYESCEAEARRENEAVPEEQTETLPEKTGETLKEMEWETMYRILQEEGENYTRAAERLGIHRTTLWRKMKQYKQKL